MIDFCERSKKVRVDGLYKIQGPAVFQLVFYRWAVLLLLKFGGYDDIIVFFFLFR